MLNLPSGGAQTIELEGSEASLVCIEGKLLVVSAISEYLLLPGTVSMFRAARRSGLKGALNNPGS